MFFFCRVRNDGYDRKEVLNMNNEKLKNKLRTEIELLNIKMLMNLFSGHTKEAEEAKEKRNQKIKKYVSLQ